MAVLATRARYFRTDSGGDVLDAWRSAGSRLGRLLGLESGADALIEDKALLSEELLPLAPGDDVDRYGLLFLGGRGLRVGIYAQDFVVEEYSLDGDQETQDVVCVG